LTSIVDPDPARSEIICKLESGSVIKIGSGFRFGFETRSKSSSVFNKQIQSNKNLQILLNSLFGEVQMIRSSNMGGDFFKPAGKIK
jgi:hypothetical protein